MDRRLQDIINISIVARDALIEGRITVTEANKILKACRKALRGGGGIVGAGIDPRPMSARHDLRRPDHESASQLFGPFDSPLLQGDARTESDHDESSSAEPGSYEGVTGWSDKPPRQRPSRAC
jgi:hypothetical protein